MRRIAACLLLLLLCRATPVEAAGKQPQEYRIVTSTTGDFPAIATITWLDYWNAAFVGFGGTYLDAFTMARDAAARGGWETANIVPETSPPATSGPIWLILMIHTAGDQGPCCIIGTAQ